MPGNTKKRRKKHRGTQTGSIQRARRRPRNRQEAMAQAKSGAGKRKGPVVDRRDIKPTWNSATKRGLVFALLLLPISLLFGQTIGSAIILTIIAAIFYVPLGFYTETFFYNRRQARKVKQQAEAKAKKERGEKDDG